MSDFIIRTWRPEDVPALKTLWKTVFGDPEAYIDLFFEKFLTGENCVVAEADGRAVSGMYILPGEAVYPYRRNVLSAGYTYALATLPEYRGRGIGRAVYKAASDRVLETCDAACVLPAGESLYPFYENASGAKAFSAVREARIAKSALDGVQPCMAARIPILQYASVREQVLSGMPHAALPLDILELMEETGTEFFVLQDGVAAAERDENGVCRILELLAPDTDPITAVAGVARWCRAEEYVVRTPAFFSGLGETRRFMLAVLRETPSYPMAEDLWWGFGLD